MAKSSKLSGNSRIRFIMVDAEIADDQIQSVTQAITNALRGPKGAPPIKRIPATPATNGAAEQLEVEAEYEEAQEEEAAAPAPSRVRAPRKAPKAPDIVHIEMNEDVSFADFAAGKKNDSVQKKYLIAAAWLHDHRNITAVTDGHIYTCFRSIGWSTSIVDFSQPLRELKSRKFFTTPERGHYAINHIGLDYVTKLGGNGAD